MPIEGLVPGEEDFGKFFDNLGELAAEKKPVPSNFGASDAAVIIPTATAPVVAAVDPPVAAAEVGATGDDAATGGTVLAPVAADPPMAAVPTADTSPAWLERFVKTIETRLPQPAQPQARQPTPLYSQDEIKLLQAFEKDWPDFAKVLPILFRGNTAANNAEIMQAIAQTVAPVLETTQTVAVDHQLNSLRQAIPDYDKVRDPVIKWAMTDPSIPGYLRNAYRGVIDAGEVGDIADLVGTWRKATGTAAPSRGGAPQLAAKENQLSEAAKQAAAALAPVVSGRTQVVQSTTPTDYDGAFEHFSKSAK